MTYATIAAPKPVTLPPSQDADSITDAVVADEKKCALHRQLVEPLPMQPLMTCFRGPWRSRLLCCVRGTKPLHRFVILSPHWVTANVSQLRLSDSNWWRRAWEAHRTQRRPVVGIAAGRKCGLDQMALRCMLTATAAAHRYILQTYARPDDMVLVSGEGCRLYDARGRSYLDFAAGIAVNALGEGALPRMSRQRVCAASEKAPWACRRSYDSRRDGASLSDHFALQPPSYSTLVDEQLHYEDCVTTNLSSVVQALVCVTQFVRVQGTATRGG